MVVVEVRQGTLTWIAVEQEEDEEDEEEEEKEDEKREEKEEDEDEEDEEEATDIKSNNPHLAGGEKHALQCVAKLITRIDDPKSWYLLILFVFFRCCIINQWKSNNKSERQGPTFEVGSLRNSVHQRFSPWSFKVLKATKAAACERQSLGWWILIWHKM